MGTDSVMISLWGSLFVVSIDESLPRIFGRAIISPSMTQNTVRSEIRPIPTDCSTARLIMIAIMPIRIIRYSVDTNGDFFINSSIEDTIMDMNNNDDDNRPMMPCSKS